MSIAARALHGVNVCILPGDLNDYRPYVLRHKPLAALSALLIASKVIAALVIGLTPSQAELSTITVERITQLTNAERTKAGLQPLKTNAKLTAAAQQKGQHMLSEDYFAHISPSGVTPWFWMSKNGYSYQVAGENLAIDFTEAEDTVAAWMASPSHKANLLHASYTETGIGVVRGEFQGGTSTIVVHMFGKPSGAQVAAEIIEATPTPAPSTAPASSPTPTPSKAPSPSPSPSPVISTPPTDTTPPRTPRIVLQDPSIQSIGSQALLSIEGEPLSTILISANGTGISTVSIPKSGTLTTSVSLSDVPDGEVILTAASSDDAGNKSGPSEKLALRKDTTGPAILDTNLYFVINPSFDALQAAFQLPSGDYSAARLNDAPLVSQSSGSWIQTSLAQPLVLSFSDQRNNVTDVPPIMLAPHFETEGSSYEQEAPSALRYLTRRLAISISLTLSIFLLLAIIIRVNVQRPSLILHTSAVIILATVIFWL